MSGRMPGVPADLLLSPPLFSIFIDARHTSQDAVLTTLRALNAQSYRNIEIFLSVPPGWEVDPYWTECCRTLRGISYLTGDGNGADDCRIWRGDYAATIPPGSRIGPHCFARAVISLTENSSEASVGIIRLEDETDILLIGRCALDDKPVPGSLPCVGSLSSFLSNASVDLTVSSKREGVELMEPTGLREAIPQRLSPVRRALRRWKNSVQKRYRKYSGLDEKERRWMVQSGMFDKDWYLHTNPDVLATQVDPLDHYLRHGWKEGRIPVQWFTREFAEVFGFEVSRAGAPLVRLARMPSNKRNELLEQMTMFRDRIEGTDVLQSGLCVVGHLCSVIGLGQAARNLGYAADAACIPLSFYDAPPAAKSAPDEEFRTKSGLIRDRRAGLHVFDAVSFVRYVGNMNPGRADILYPFWELGRLPKDSREFADSYDEIWAPSSFVADAFKAGCSRPVTVLPQPVRIPLLEARKREGAFRFLAYMDFDSYPARKNPEGPVKAFSRAFANAESDVRLCIKVRGHNDAGRRQWLADAAGRDERIEVIDRTLTRDEMDQLIMSCDAFISLHRSEGFGFGPAEAMAAGKPVISTDYSSTTDFVTEETGYPIAYRLVPLEPKSYVDWEGQVWAEPDIDDAARAMREIVDDPDAARARAMRGRQLMIERFSPEAVGRQMREMLEERGLLDAEGQSELVPAAGFEPATP